MQEAAELKLVEAETIAPMSVSDDTLDEGESASRLLDDDQLIADGEAAVERFKKSRDQILPMARGLAAAKRKYPATLSCSQAVWTAPRSASRCKMPARPSGPTPIACRATNRWTSRRRSRSLAILAGR
jgi:hypothetical protein